jgi:hypothetical protein
VTRLASVPDLERELDRLYSVPLDEFVRERDALATRLRQAHQAEAAATVAKLRKPVAVVWTANRLARQQPKAIAKLLTAAEGVRVAQERALAGAAGAPEVGAARAAERDVVRELIKSARTELDPPVAPAALERLEQTLRAAAADPTARDLLARGRLGVEVEAAGFEQFAGVAPIRRRRDEVAAAARERVKALRAEVRQLAAEARSAERAAVTAERTAETLRAEADAKHEQSRRAEEQLAAAQEDLQRRT